MNFASPYLSPVAKAGAPIGIPVIYFDDFVSGSFDATSAGTFAAVADAADWLVTREGTSDGSITMVDGGSKGAVVVTSGSTDNDSMECQVNGEAFALAEGKNLMWEMRFKIDDVTATDWFVGMAASDITVIDATPDYIGFGNTDNGADIRAINGKNNSAEIGESTAGTGQTLSDTTSDLVADTYVVLRFEVSGTSKVRFYVDGNLKATHTTNLPDDVGLTPSFGIQCTGSAEIITVDYVLAMQDR